jgi:DNA-binding transcriptional MerR regulator
MGATVALEADFKSRRRAVAPVTEPDPMSEDPLLDIAEVAEHTGVAPSALRYYERLGLLEPAGRNGLRRTYAPSAIDRIALIVNARATGFSLAEVKALLDAPDRTVRQTLVAKAEEIDRQIEVMRRQQRQLAHALTCEHDSILACPTFQAGLRQALPR